MMWCDVKTVRSVFQFCWYFTFVIRCLLFFNDTIDVDNKIIIRLYITYLIHSTVCRAKFRVFWFSHFLRCNFSGFLAIILAIILNTFLLRQHPSPRVIAYEYQLWFHHDRRWWLFRRCREGKKNAKTSLKNTRPYGVTGEITRRIFFRFLLLFSSRWHRLLPVVG